LRCAAGGKSTLCVIGRKAHTETVIQLWGALLDSAGRRPTSAGCSRQSSGVKKDQLRHPVISVDAPGRRDAPSRLSKHEIERRTSTQLGPRPPREKAGEKSELRAWLVGCLRIGRREWRRRRTRRTRQGGAEGSATTVEAGKRLGLEAKTTWLCIASVTNRDQAGTI